MNEDIFSENRDGTASSPITTNETIDAIENPSPASLACPEPGRGEPSRREPSREDTGRGERSRRGAAREPERAAAATPRMSVRESGPTFYSKAVPPELRQKLQEAETVRGNVTIIVHKDR